MSGSRTFLIIGAILSHSARLGLADQSYLPFVEEEGLLVMEAESVPVVEPWKYETGVEGFTGIGYYRFDGNTVQSGPPDGLLSYQFWIKNPGTYRMELRSYKNDPDGTWANDCFTRLVDHSGYQGGTIKTFQPGNTFEWSYLTQHDYWNDQYGFEDKPIPYYTFENAGFFTFELQGRSKNFHVDRIVMFDESKVHADEARDPSVPESERREVDEILSFDSAPTSPVTSAPSKAPTPAPTTAPITTTSVTAVPTSGPTSAPNITTAAPTAAPTTAAQTTAAPVTAVPTSTPTTSPTSTPTNSPTSIPTVSPTQAPTTFPTSAPTASSPTTMPTNAPTLGPMSETTPSPTPLRVSQSIADFDDDDKSNTADDETTALTSHSSVVTFSSALVATGLLLLLLLQ